MPRWAYHGTRPSLLPQIAASGLTPAKASRFPTRKYVYFSDEYELAADYGDVILRFPWPIDARGFTFEDEGVEEYVSPGAIPPHLIKVYHRDRWVPVRKFRRS
ncbi:MAG: hypothetical protein ACRD1X_17915 [Vicinamibacteria bacterium]